MPGVEVISQRVTHMASADSPCTIIRSFASNDTSSTTSDNLSRSLSDKVLQSGTLRARVTQATTQYPVKQQLTQASCESQLVCSRRECRVRIQEALVLFAFATACGRRDGPACEDIQPSRIILSVCISTDQLHRATNCSRFVRVLARAHV
jgi:hypothetical protein